MKAHVSVEGVGNLNEPGPLVQHDLAQGSAEDCLLNHAGARERSRPAIYARGAATLGSGWRPVGVPVKQQTSDGPNSAARPAIS